ncbi:MAG: DUF2589 domain-containing protein [Ruminiclostridium sp.]|nr:DUF2589 domain-containing protein [Ruminiclostridium sp.]
MDINGLLNNIGAAITDAHKAIEQSSADFFLERYFEKSPENGADNLYTPKMLKIKIPDSSGDRTVSAPMAILVNHGCLNIDSVKLRLNIDMLEQKENEFSVSPAKGGENKGNTGEMEIVFKYSDTVEGVSRVETHLNSLL